MNENWRYLITGGTGFLGTELVRQLYVEWGCRKLRVLARNGVGLVRLRERFPQIEIVSGSVGSRDDVKRAMSRIDGVFHLAAFKFADRAEKEPIVCVQTNVNGTINVLQESLWTQPQFVLGVSTDKAIEPVGVYGMTKALQERMFESYANGGLVSNYQTGRLGNIFGSSGSVIEKWKEAEPPLFVTDLKATRFFLTVAQAARLIIKSSMDGQRLFVPELKAARLVDILEVVAPGKTTLEVGLRPGEKLHEKMSEGGISSEDAPKWTKEELREII